MPKSLQGQLTANGQRFAIVVSRFNEFITSRLLAGALDALQRHGCKDEDMTVVYVPGAFEIPLIAKKLAESKAYSAVVCLGCVIRGQTPHFDYVAGESAKGIAQVALAIGVPTVYGVLTTDTLEQAIDRAGAKAGNKGYDAALNAIELANLIKLLPSPT
jgi:6,7-dimethyl-8-ribityllumazine synthase